MLMMIPNNVFLTLFLFHKNILYLHNNNVAYKKEMMLLFKKFKNSILAILLTFIIMPYNILAYSDYVIAGGNNIGMELNANGVIIVGLYEVNNSSPASVAGLKVGDIITSINNKTISTINEMVSEINKSENKDSILIEFLRNNKKISTSLELKLDENGVYKSGLYVKDSISGVGTLTFIDPNTKLFGALGHEIIEKTTGKILEIKEGKIFKSEVTGIIPSENGNPGEKKATFHSDQVIGNVNENTNKGVFGTYQEISSNDSSLYKVAKPDEIKTGEAKILTVLNDNQISEHSINILKTNNKTKTKNILFEITDQELLNKTGGIIQGMSGSPIIQDNNIIGAITHVVVDNPTRGYGIFITNMLEEAEN